MSKRLKYLYRTAGLVSGVLVALVLAGLVYLETSRFQQFLQDRINQAIPGQISWEDMDVSLLSGEIRLREATLKGKSGDILTRVPSLEVGMDWTGLLSREIQISSVLVTSPRIVLDISKQGDVNLIDALIPPQDPGSASKTQGIPLNLKIRKFRIRNAELDITAPDYTVMIPDLNIRISDINLAAFSASVKTDLRNSRVKYQDMDLTLASLELNGRVEWDMISDLNIRAETSGISLDANGEILQILENPFIDVTADIQVDTRAAGRIFDIDADGTGTLSLKVKGTVDNPKVNLTAAHGPGLVEGHHISALRLSADLENRILTLRSSELELDIGKLLLNGTFDLQKMFPFGFIEEATTLENLSYNLTVRQNGFPLSGLPIDNLDGSLSSVMTMTGQGVKKTRIAADVTAAGVTYPPMQSPAEIKIQSLADFTGEQLRITDLKITGPGIEGSGNGRLDLPGFNPDLARMTGSLKVEMADLSIPARLLGMTATGHGTLSAQADGLFLSPEIALTINARDVTIQGGHADMISARARLDSDGLYIDEVLVREKDGVLLAKGRVGTETDPALNLEVSLGDMGLAAIIPGQGLQGTLDGLISVKGTMGAPVATATINGNNITKADIPIGNIQTDISLSKGILSIDRADIVQKNSLINIRGRVGLTDRTVDIRLTAPDLDLTQIGFIETPGLKSGLISLDLTANGALEAPDLKGHLSIKNARAEDSMGLYGDLEAAFHSQGPLTDLPQVKATINISSLAISRDNQALIQVRDTAATIREGRIVLGNTPVSVLTQGHLTLSGQADLNGNLEAAASGTIPLALAVPLADGIRSATGDVRVSLAVKGSVQTPEIRGTLEFDDLGLSLEDLEQPIQKVAGLIRFTPETIEIERLRGNLDQGLFQISGRAGLEEGSLDKFSLDLTAHQLPLDIPETLSLTLNSKLKLSGTPEKSDLTGDIVLLEGRYYRDVDLDLIDLSARRTRKVETAESGIGPLFLKTIALNIHVGRREPLLVDNNLAYLTVSPDLTVRGTAHTPILAGRARVDEGTLSFQRARFEVIKGTIDFINPYRIEPVIDLAGETTIRSWTITLSVSGTPDNLDLSFSSDPSETDADIISLIAFGKTTREMGTAQGSGQMASAGMVAGIVAGPLEETLKNATGLDEVDIRMEDSEGTTGVHVSLGADLSRQLSVSYGVDIRDGETVQRVTTYYKLLEHLLMSGFQDTGGRFGGELKYRLEFR